VADEVDAWLAATGPAPAAPGPDPVDQWLAATAPAPRPAPAPVMMPHHGPNFDPGQEVPGEADQALRQKILTAGGAGVTVGAPQTADQMAAGAARRARAAREDEIGNDPLAQQIVAGVLGGAAGKLVGPIAARLGPVVGRTVTGATEGAVSSKEAGGSALAGGIVGGALGGVGGIVQGASARVRARALKDVVQGEGETAMPTKSLVRKLQQRSGEEGERLGEVLDQDPGLEHTLSTAAARNPKKALESVQGIIEKNDALNAPVYQAITDAGGVKLTDVVAPMQKLKDGYLGAGQGQAAEAVQREIDSLVKNYGGKQAENAVLTGQQLQGMRNELGAAAFGTTPMASRALKTQVKRDLYGAYRGAIEDATAQLEDVAPGVNLERFRARNKSTSVLIPMRDVLKDRLANEQVGAKSFVGRARELVPEMMAGGMLGEGVHLAGGGLKEAIGAALATKVIPAVGRGVAQVGRHIDYGISRMSPHVGEPTALAEAVGARVKDAAAESITPEDAARAAGTGAAAKEAKGASAGRLLNGVRWFGRPATEAERTEAGLPASLQHALDTNDPNLGHAALVHEVLAR
jgi:hypothetical protein